MITPQYHRLAEQELNEAAQFYESESPGLGALYLDEIERCVREIVEFPKSGLVLERNVRRRLIRGFPYAVLYSWRERDFRILAVMNLRRRPTYWVERE